ncbi:hypothetical protein [Oceanobacillus sp. J11TS1]|uniref:hypothetical protein n=1 Tax=Oceanobacillus sp. J11TS1 TaxID=2807191 RepID=UPI001BB37886|nr:hypothetical protein [Oceanobacillus sp. J11TS1]
MVWKSNGADLPQVRARVELIGADFMVMERHVQPEVERIQHKLERFSHFSSAFSLRWSAFHG